MARTRMSPIPLAKEMQTKMQMASPDIYLNERDPRRFSSWDQRRIKATKSLPYPRYFHNESFLPNKPCFNMESTPDSPEFSSAFIPTPSKTARANPSTKTQKSPVGMNQLRFWDSCSHIQGMMKHQLSMR